jgi:oligopeptide transport system substrate-binding protein
MFNADPSMTAQAQSLYGDELVFIPRPIIFYLFFRVDQAPFDDVRVRKAFVHALDREAFVREAFDTPRQAALGGFIPPGIPGHSPEIGLQFDLEQANHLLDEAGYGDRKSFPVIGLYHVLDPGGEKIVSYLQSSWEENLRLKLQTVGLEWDQYIQKVDHAPGPMSLMGTSADYPDPDYLLRVIFHSSEGFNRVCWKDDDFDSLVEEAARVTDQAKRMELYREADRILMADQAVILPLTYGQGRILLKPQINLRQSPPVSIRLKDFLLMRKEGEGIQ